MPLNLKTASGGSVIITGANTASDRTITVPAVDGNMLYSDASGNAQINSGYGSLATSYVARAWVNFNGTGTVAIRASGNVSSITDNGTGDYTVNFTTAMPDANYSVSSVSMRNDVSGASSNGVFSVVFGSTTYADAMKTGSVRIECKLTTSNVDPLAAFVAIFR